MNILAHRGLWEHSAEKNTLASLLNAHRQGFGVETDIREQNGKIIISHDVPTSDPVLDLESYLHEYSDSSYQSDIALNIKADGLKEEILSLIKKYSIKNYYLFDMSIPEMIDISKTELQYLVRVSEVEDPTKWKREPYGIWVDFFEENWITIDDIGFLAKNYNQIVFASADLHNRDHQGQWALIKSLTIGLPNRISLCTDYPQEAVRFFNDQ